MNVAQEKHAAVLSLIQAMCVEQDVQILLEDSIARAVKATACREAQCAQVGGKIKNPIRTTRRPTCRPRRLSADTQIYTNSVHDANSLPL